MEFSWTNHVRNEVLQRVKQAINIIHTVNRRKANWIGHSLRVNCLLKYIIEGKTGGRIKVIGSGGRRRKQLLAAFNEKREQSILKIEEETQVVIFGKIALEEAMGLS